MIRFVKNWLSGEKTKPKPAPVPYERFGKITLARRNCLNLISYSKASQQYFETLRTKLGTGSENEKVEFVDRPLARLAVWILDLPLKLASSPASPASDFTLLEHTLKLVYNAVSTITAPGFRFSRDPAEQFTQKYKVAYAAFLVGILRGAARAGDLRVNSSNGEIWNPLGGPVSLYRDGLSLPIFGGGTLSWSGDGAGPKFTAREFLPLLIPESAVKFGGRWFPMILDACQTDDPDHTSRTPAAQKIADVITSLDSTGLANPESERHSHRASHAKVSTDNKPASPIDDPQTAMPPVPVESKNKLPVKKPDLASPLSQPAGENTSSPVLPSEVPKRIRVELDPARLLGTLRLSLCMGILHRNRSRAPAYIRKDFVWFEFPHAFCILAENQWRFTYSPALGTRILNSLSECPQVVPKSASRVLLHVCARESIQRPKPFVRIRTKGFLSENDLALLGTWPHPLVNPLPPGAPS